MTTPPAGDGDAIIDEALCSANDQALIGALVQLTGDMALLKEAWRPSPTMMGMLGTVSPEGRTTLFEHARDVIARVRDGTLPPAPALSMAQVGTVLAFLLGQPQDADYLPLAMRDLGIAEPAPAPAPIAPGRRALIVGAGMSGIVAAIKLREAGVECLIVEKNGDVGGTWLENRYPGVRVDSANHLYAYSFAPNPDWSEYFSQGPEILAYFRRVADTYGLREDIRFGTALRSATFDAAGNRWRAIVEGPAGEERIEADILVSAVGQLNVPRLPDIPGLDSFEGPVLHTARWDPDLDLSGKRVAAIGTGASATQMVPEVAKVAAHLTLFQRSAPWIAPVPHYRREIEPGKSWLLRHLPGYAHWYRFILWITTADQTLPAVLVDPDWADQDRSINPLSAMIRGFLEGSIRQQAADRPDLLPHLIPAYPPFGSRMLLDDGTWVETLKRDNVTLVIDGIDRILPHAVVDRAGRSHAADVLALATGFHADRFLWPMEIVGRDGVRLHDRWGDEPRAHFGVTVPGFPNLFILYGPATNLAHGGSIIFNVECQVDLIVDAVRRMAAAGGRTIEVAEPAFAAHVDELEQLLARTVWAHPKARNWYTNRNGKVINTSPWRLIDYWRWTREVPDDAYLIG